MNKHPYKLDPDFKLNDKGLTGWSFPDAILTTKCPKCGCDKGFMCEMPSGRKAWPPHSERLTGASS